MIYRILEANEWGRLEEIIPSEYIPHPDASVCAIAENDRRSLVGALPLQLALHMEPLVLKDPSVNFTRLYETLMSAVKEDKGLHIYCFSDKEIINRMAAHVGMMELPFKVFQKVVE